ncbi:MAG: hypothetical protein AB1705_21520 [Verrucomicrobiota bacterium]
MFANLILDYRQGNRSRAVIRDYYKQTTITDANGTASTTITLDDDGVAHLITDWSLTGDDDTKTNYINRNVAAKLSLQTLGGFNLQNDYTPQDQFSPAQNIGRNALPGGLIVPPKTIIAADFKDLGGASGNKANLVIRTVKIFDEAFLARLLGVR